AGRLLRVMKRSASCSTTATIVIRLKSEMPNSSGAYSSSSTRRSTRCNSRSRKGGAGIVSSALMLRWATAMPAPDYSRAASALVQHGVVQGRVSLVGKRNGGVSAARARADLDYGAVLAVPIIAIVVNRGSIGKL